MNKFNVGDRVICCEIKNPKWHIVNADRNGHGQGWQKGHSFKITRIDLYSGSTHGPIYIGGIHGNGVYEDSIRLESEWDA